MTNPKINQAYQILLTQAKKEDISLYTRAQIVALMHENQLDWDKIDNNAIDGEALFEKLLTNDMHIPEVNKRLFTFAVEYVMSKNISAQNEWTISLDQLCRFERLCHRHLEGPFIDNAEALIEAVSIKTYRLLLSKNGRLNQAIIGGLEKMFHTEHKYLLIASTEDLSRNIMSRQDKEAFVRERFKWWDMELRQAANQGVGYRLENFKKIVTNIAFWEAPGLATLAYEIVNQTEEGFPLYPTLAKIVNPTLEKKRAAELFAEAQKRKAEFLAGTMDAAPTYSECEAMQLTEEEGVQGFIAHLGKFDYKSIQELMISIKFNELMAYCMPRLKTVAQKKALLVLVQEHSDIEEGLLLELALSKLSEIEIKLAANYEVKTASDAHHLVSVLAELRKKLVKEDISPHLEKWLSADDSLPSVELQGAISRPCFHATMERVTHLMARTQALSDKVKEKEALRVYQWQQDERLHIKDALQQVDTFFASTPVPSIDQQHRNHFKTVAYETAALQLFPTSTLMRSLFSFDLANHDVKQKRIAQFNALLGLLLHLSEFLDDPQIASQLALIIRNERVVPASSANIPAMTYVGPPGLMTLQWQPASGTVAAQPVPMEPDHDDETERLLAECPVVPDERAQGEESKESVAMQNMSRRLAAI